MAIPVNKQRGIGPQSAPLEVTFPSVRKLDMKTPVRGTMMMRMSMMVIINVIMMSVTSSMCKMDNMGRTMSRNFLAIWMDGEWGCVVVKKPGSNSYLGREKYNSTRFKNQLSWTIASKQLFFAFSSFELWATACGQCQRGSSLSGHKAINEGISSFLIVQLKAQKIRHQGPGTINRSIPSILPLLRQTGL